jgi:hypothetical protein
MSYVVEATRRYRQFSIEHIRYRCTALVTDMLFLVIFALLGAIILSESLQLISASRRPLHSFGISLRTSTALNVRLGGGIDSSGGALIKWDKNCKVCKGKGAVSCAPCSGTGIDKVNGNIFERF